MNLHHFQSGHSTSLAMETETCRLLHCNLEHPVGKEGWNDHFVHHHNCIVPRDTSFRAFYKCNECTYETYKQATSQEHLFTHDKFNETFNRRGNLPQTLSATSFSAAAKIWSSTRAVYTAFGCVQIQVVTRHLITELLW